MQFTDVVCRTMTLIENQRVNLHHSCGVFYICSISPNKYVIMVMYNS